MSGEMGSIFSPGFGGDYFNFLSCRWTINVADPYVVRLAFQSFDLETDRDFLIVTGVIDSPLTSLVSLCYIYYRRAPLRKWGKGKGSKM